MEGRIRSLLLGCTYICLAMTSITAHAAELEVEQVAKPVIQPDIERMEFEESKINPNNFEISASFGLLSIEDFGTNSLLVVKLAYRVSENFFVNLETGASAAGKTSIETLLPGNPLLSSTERDYSYYLVNLGYDIFPGESFVTNNTTLNTALYVVGGAGNTRFGGSDNFTISYGVGYRVIVNSYLTGYFDVRNHTFQRDIYGEDKLTNNIEFSFGVGFYF
jgi:outer membrane beta-barrel protein